MSTDTASALDLAQESAPHRSGRDPRAGRPRRRQLRARRAAALRVSRPGDRHRHGQVGHHLPEDRGDPVEHRHGGLVPAPRRSHARRSRRHSRRRCGHRALAQRRDRGAGAAARIDPPAGREADRHYRRPRIDAGQGRRRHARLLHRRRSLSDEPRADGQHHRRSRDGRRAGDDAPRPQGVPRRSVRVAASGRQARPPADAGRKRHGQRRRRADRADDDADAGRLSRDVEQAARHDRRHRRRRPARRRLHRRRPAAAHEPVGQRPGPHRGRSDDPQSHHHRPRTAGGRGVAGSWRRTRLRR